MDINEFKLVAKNQLATSLAKTLELINKNVKRDSDSFNNVILFKSRYSQTISDFHTNIITKSERDLSLDKLRVAILDLISNLLPEDINQDIKNTIENTYSELPVEIAHVFTTTGLTYAYPERSSAINDMLNDISNAQNSVCMYARVYISELVKGTMFSPAIMKAAANSLKGDSPLLIRHVSCDSTDKVLAQKQYAIEDPDKKRWNSLEDYQTHLKWSTEVFEERYRDVLNLSESKKYKNNPDRKTILFENGFLRESLLPYSLVIIDNKIIYVSFYALSSNRYGTFAPTMRLVSESNEETSWADRFLEEKEKIDNNFTPKVKKYPVI